MKVASADGGIAVQLQLQRRRQANQEAAALKVAVLESQKRAAPEEQLGGVETMRKKYGEKEPSVEGVITRDYRAYDGDSQTSVGMQHLRLFRQ